MARVSAEAKSAGSSPDVVMAHARSVAVADAGRSGDNASAIAEHAAYTGLGFILAEDLDRDRTPELGIEGTVDIAHGSRSDQSLDDVATDRGPALESRAQAESAAALRGAKTLVQTSHDPGYMRRPHTILRGRCAVSDAHGPQEMRGVPVMGLLAHKNNV